jgi:hypothetical protein
LQNVPGDCFASTGSGQADGGFDTGKKSARPTQPPALATT